MAYSTNVVHKMIEKDGAIRADLGRDLINIRALARHLQQRIYSETSEEISLDAIISSIRRYPVKEKFENYAQIGTLIQKLTMRNKIVDVSMPNEPEVQSAIGRIATKIDYSRGETFRVVAGVEAIRVMIDERNIDKLEQLPRKIFKMNKGLAEIIVALSEVAELTPGVVATVTTELAMNGINMIEFMSCVPELILVVEEKDALRSYELLQNLAKGKEHHES